MFDVMAPPEKHGVRFSSCARCSGEFVVVTENPIVIGTSTWGDLEHVKIGCPQCDGDEAFLDAKKEVRGCVTERRRARERHVVSCA